MTDSEIIKAFEICNNSSLNCSDGCPYHKKEIGHYCLYRLNSDALDLIHRQKAEIERLNVKIKDVYKELERIALMSVATDSKEMVGDNNE